MLQQYIKIASKQLQDEIRTRLGIIRFLPSHPRHMSYSIIPFPCIYILASDKTLKRLNLETSEVESFGDLPFVLSYARTKLFALSSGDVLAFYADTNAHEIKPYLWNADNQVWNELSSQSFNDSHAFIHHSCFDDDSNKVYIGIQSADPGELYCYNIDDDSWNTLPAQDLRGVDCVWNNKVFASVQCGENYSLDETERFTRDDVMWYLDLSNMTWKEFDIKFPKQRCGWAFNTSRIWLANIKGVLYCISFGSDYTIHGQQYEQRGELFKYDAEHKVWLHIDIHPQISRYLASQSPCYTFSDTHLYIGHIQAGAENAWSHAGEGRELFEIPLKILEEA